MAELMIRAGASDAALLRRTFGLGGIAAARRPSRIVVDAHVPIGSDLVTTARTAGVPFLVDPQTYFLQDEQHSGFAWTKLPFATARRVNPAELRAPGAIERLVAQCVEHQLACGATMVIAPYVHIDRIDSSWIDVQARLWRVTRDHLDRERCVLDVVAVVAVGWRLLHPIRGRAALAPATRELRHLRPVEIAVAATRAHEGVHSMESLHDLLVLVSDISRQWPVIVWQQGILGEACVAAGAIGYETGIGWREHCDLQSAMAQHRRPPTGPPGARPVYVDALRRSVPRRTIEQLRHDRATWSWMICEDQGCCPPAGEGMLGDARQHAITARSRSLDTLTGAHSPNWRWNQLGASMRTATRLAHRINRLADGSADISRIETRPMLAVQAVADQRCQQRPLRATA